jgi:hypothetical protein
MPITMSKLQLILNNFSKDTKEAPSKASQKLPLSSIRKYKNWKA